MIDEPQKGSYGIQQPSFQLMQKISKTAKGSIPAVDE